MSLLIGKQKSLLDHVLINGVENKTSLLDHVLIKWKTKHLYLIMSLLILGVENKISLLDHVLINSLIMSGKQNIFT